MTGTTDTLGTWRLVLRRTIVALTLAGNFVAGIIVGRSARHSDRASANVGLTIASPGELSIIVGSICAAGGLSGVLQPFAASRKERIR